MSLLNAESCFIFTDTETSGLNINFSQIIQVGSILSNDSIEVEDTQDLNCNLLPWVVPSPEAFLVHRRVESLVGKELSHYEMMLKLRQEWLDWSSSRNPVFITYNGHRFDEELFRRQFYWCLLPSYITNTEGASRLDLMYTFQLIANFFSHCVQVPRNDEGEVSLKLTDWANQNDISSEGAHDALNDCYLMVELSKIVKDKAGAAWKASLKGSSKGGNLNLIQSEPFAMLGEVFRKKTFPSPITFCGQNPKFTNEVAVLDLCCNPDELDEYTDNELLEQIGTSGTAIRKLKINRSLPIMPSDQIPNLKEHLENMNVTQNKVEENAFKIRNNVNLQKRISELMANNQISYPEPKFVEQSVYAGFASKADELWMERFHSEDWNKKATLINGFEDKRYKELAERLVCSNSPNSISSEANSKYKLFLKERIHSKGPWLDLKGAKEKTDKLLLETKDDEDKKILEQLKDHLKSMALL